MRRFAPASTPRPTHPTHPSTRPHPFWGRTHPTAAEKLKSARAALDAQLTAVEEWQERKEAHERRKLERKERRERRERERERERAVEMARREEEGNDADIDTDAGTNGDTDADTDTDTKGDTATTEEAGDTAMDVDVHTHAEDTPMADPPRRPRRNVTSEDRRRERENDAIAVELKQMVGIPPPSMEVSPRMQVVCNLYRMVVRSQLPVSPVSPTGAGWPGGKVIEG